MLGDKISELRGERRWTQPELAKRVGVSPITINRWENGKTNVADKNKRLLARAFGVEPRTFGLVEAQPPEVSTDGLDMVGVVEVWVSHMERSFGRITEVLEGLLNTTHHMQDEASVLKRKLAQWAQRLPAGAEVTALKEMFDEAEVIAARRALARYRKAQAVTREIDEAQGEETKDAG